MLKRVLLTGATGFIGSHLLVLLRGRGVCVQALGRSRPEGVESFALWDLAAEAGPDVSELEGVDAVFHLAGKAHALSERRQDEDEYFRINTAATEKLLKAAQRAGVRRFVYISSVKAADEDTPYARSKREAEKRVLEGGLLPAAVVIRPAMVYGNTAKGNLPRMIRLIEKGRFPPVPEFGNRRSMVHVEDLVQAAWLTAVCPEAAGKIYTVTDGYAYSTHQIYTWISEAVGRPVPSWHVPAVVLRMLAYAGDAVGRLRGRRFMFDSDTFGKLAGSAYFSNEKIVRELGWRPTRDLRKSLPEMIGYLREAGR